MIKKLPKKIIIVDYKQSRRDVIASRFRLQGGFYVELASGGFQALSQIEKDIYDCAIITGNQPDMSALELIGLMRGVFDKDEMQIIFSTKRIDEQDLIAIMKAGANEFVVESAAVFGSFLEKIEAFRPKKDRKPKSIMSLADSHNTNSDK